MDDQLKAHIQTHERLSRLMKKDIVFVVGATRWGTSWVQQCLDTHPKVVCKGEGHYTDSLFPGLAKLVDQYNQDAEKIGNRMQLAGLPGNAAGFTFDDVEHLMRTAVMLMFNRWVPEDVEDEVTCIGEKTPEHVLSLELLDRLFPGMRIVHVVRDGRDEAAGAWDFNMGISRGEFPRRYPSFADFAERLPAIGRARSARRAGSGGSTAADIIKFVPKTWSKSHPRLSAVCSAFATSKTAKTWSRRVSAARTRSHRWI